MDYTNILSYIDNIIEEIEFDELTLLEVKDKLCELSKEIEETIELLSEEEEGFSFEDLI